MKKKQFKRFIAWGFTVLAVFLIASFSVPFQSFADDIVLNITVSRTAYFDDTNRNIYMIYSLDGVSYSVAGFIGNSFPKVFTFHVSSSSNFYFSFRNASGTRYWDNSLFPSDGSLQSIDVVNGSANISLNLNYDNSYSHICILSFIAATPTPSPSPTPTPVPTTPPTPTQDPTITSDIQFWGRVNTNANGFWQVLTQIFNGIFNNVVMRNMIVYIPLFGLIITLVVYLFTFGGRHD